MASFLPRQPAATAAVPPACRMPAGGREGELAHFDLRQTLAEMTVRESSFNEFLEALKQQHGSAA